MFYLIINTKTIISDMYTCKNDIFREQYIPTDSFYQIHVHETNLKVKSLIDTCLDWGEV